MFDTNEILSRVVELKEASGMTVDELSIKSKVPLTSLKRYLKTGQKVGRKAIQISKRVAPSSGFRSFLFHQRNQTLLRTAGLFFYFSMLRSVKLVKKLHFMVIKCEA